MPYTRLPYRPQHNCPSAAISTTSPFFNTNQILEFGLHFCSFYQENRQAGYIIRKTDNKIQTDS